MALHRRLHRQHLRRSHSPPPKPPSPASSAASWPGADKYRSLQVRTNADTPKDAKQAVNFGAEGIGLCRTEHMFFDPDRIAAIREMIVSETLEQRGEGAREARAHAAG